MTEGGVAVHAEPASEVTVLMAVIERDLACVVVADFAAIWFWSKRLGLLFGEPVVANVQPVSVRFIGGALFRAVSFGVFGVGAIDRSAMTVSFGIVGLAAGFVQFAAQAAARPGCLSQQCVGPDFFLFAAVAKTVPPYVARLGIGMAATDDDKSGELSPGEIVAVFHSRRIRQFLTL